MLTVEYRADVDEEIGYGFIISNMRGIEVYGTKSAFFGQHLPPEKAGTTFECKLEVPLVLVPGAYFVTAALARLHGHSYFDYRFDVLEFEVVGAPRCLQLLSSIYRAAFSSPIDFLSMQRGSSGKEKHD